MLSASAGAVLQTTAVYDEIFISFRFSEAHAEAQSLKAALAARGVRAFLSDFVAGDDLQTRIADALAACRLVIILASSSYGKATNDMFDTGREMDFVLGERKPYYLVRMIPWEAVWAENKTVLAFPKSIMMKIWQPGSAMPTDLVDEVCRKLAAVCSTPSLSQSARPNMQASLAATSLSAGGPPDISDGARPTAQSLQEYPRLPKDGYELQRRVHQINVNYPGLQLIHEEPYIFVVRDFLCEKECRDLVLLHSLAAKDPSATSPEQAAKRTSTTVVPPREDIGWLRERISKLVKVDQSQLDPTKLSHYDKGQFFGRHTDTDGKALGDVKHQRLLDAMDTLVKKASWFAAANRAAALPKAQQVYQKGLEASGLGQVLDRFASVFIYLNDVPEGGRTIFSKLNTGSVINEQCENLDVLRERVPSHVLLSRQPASPASVSTAASTRSITPRAGMAVLHFPTTTPDYLCLPDMSTMHESEPAVAPKYIVQQFIWAAPVHEARKKIAAHNAPYVRCMEEGAAARGAGGLVLAQAGQPLRYVMANEVRGLSHSARAALRDDVERNMTRGKLVIMELDANEEYQSWTTFMAS